VSSASGRAAPRDKRDDKEDQPMSSTLTPAATIQHDAAAHPASGAEGLVRVGPRSDLNGVTVVSGGRHGIAVFAPSGTGEIYAVDNRCPHMGFPLDRGSVCDGILTCHWHHARFDLASGGTFDPFADDVQTYAVVLRDDVVFVDPRPRRNDRVAHAKARLHDGLEQSISLVLAKNVLALLDAGEPAADILRIGGEFGAAYRAAGWRSGLTILTAMGNALPALATDDRVLALYHGLVHVARDSAGQPPRHFLDPLPGSDIPGDRLANWFRQFIEVRDGDGAERALLTAIHQGASPAELAGMLATATTDHAFIDGGHTLDFVNKACELLDLVGWQHAAAILPSLTPVLAGSTRSEELNSWRRPVDLIELLEPVFDRIEAIAASAGSNTGWHAPDGMIARLLGDDPASIVDAITAALECGAPLEAVSRAVSYAAALRVAHFHTSNEFGDWITVLHTFTYANATHQLMRRAPSAALLRGVYHGAMALYLTRFLNMPAARLPETRASALDTLPVEADDILATLRDALDREQQVELAGQLAWRHLSRGHEPESLIATLGHVLLREDGEFHSYQMLEAGLALYRELAGTEPERANRVLVAVARYLAAHAPTSRAMLQTARTARRLAAGEDLYAEVD
jgi:nitrite reductase/ring-hydroxylating ferredoxin subunit